MKGEVVGMNTSSLRDAEGINFAIRYNVLNIRLEAMMSQAESSTPPTPGPTSTPASWSSYGPVSGEIEHNLSDGFISTYKTGFEMKNGIMEARFYNPYPPSVGSWNSGFFFRWAGPEIGGFHLVGIRSDSTWIHVLRLDGDTSDNDQVNSGYAGRIRTVDGAYNDIKVVAYGNGGELYVNGYLIADLDLSGLTEKGWVFLTATFYTTDGVDGYSTQFENLTIESWD